MSSQTCYIFFYLVQELRTICFFSLVQELRTILFHTLQIVKVANANPHIIQKTGSRIKYIRTAQAFPAFALVAIVAQPQKFQNCALFIKS